MTHLDVPKVGYVVKRYPRYSETFIVNEILAHEAAGLQMEIHALRPCEDGHFQDAIARVRAPVHYLVAAEGLRAATVWETLNQASEELPGLWSKLKLGRGTDVREVYQAVMLARTVRRQGIGHLHAHFATSATTVAWLASHLAGVPYTFTTHAKDIFHESVRPNELRRTLSAAAAVVTVSNYNLQFLRNHYGPAAARVQRVYNGLDLQQFTYVSPQHRPPLIVGVGRLVEKKGFSDLIDACAILASRGRQFRCQIIGTGELEADLRAQIDRLGLGTCVQLLGPRPQNELTKLVQGAAVLAAPCVIGGDGNRDGLPTVLLEAMALGTPCVATDVTGIPEAIRDGQTGLLIPQRDLAALASAIDRLLTDAGLRVHLAQCARHLIEQEFDVHRNAERLRHIFQTAQRKAVRVA